MKHILICDDEPQVLSCLQELVDRVWQEEHDIYTFSSREELLRFLSCQREDPSFILLLDVMLGKESSIPSSAQLLKHMTNLKVIYVSGHIEYCEDIFFSSPTGFLVKPVKEERLLYLLQKASRELDEESGQLLSVFSIGGERCMIPAREILYLESAGRIVTIHALREEVKCIRKLDELEQLLPYGFLRCHQSYLVNCSYIQSTVRHQLLLKNGHLVPIAKTRKHEVREFLFRLAEESL